MANHEPQIHSNALLNSVVHSTFGHAITSIGCTPFGAEKFGEQYQALLQNHSQSAAELAQVGVNTSYRALMGGEVIATEHGEDSSLRFLVRAGIHAQFVDFWVTYHNSMWILEAVTSIHSRPIHRRRWFLPTASAVAALVALGVGYVAAPKSQAWNKDQVTAWASSHGYQLVTNDTSSHNAKTSPSVSSSAEAKTAPKSSTASHPSKTSTKPSKPNSSVQTLTFTLQPGMSLHDLSRFLSSHHMVKNAETFDMALKHVGADEAARPGTYVFKSNMSESQLVSVVKAGPKK